MTHQASSPLPRTLTTNVTGISICIGLLAGMDTLCSQAHGAGNYAREGIVLQRALCICITCLIPIIILWQFTDQILVGLGQDEDLAAMAGQYTRIISLGVPGFLLTEGTRRFLENQGIVKPVFYVTLFVVGPHIGWVIFLTGKYGFVGTAWAMNISYWTMASLVLLYVIVIRPHHPQSWPGFQPREALQGWGEYLKLGIPGMSMLCLEWWSFEVLR